MQHVSLFFLYLGSESLQSKFPDLLVLLVGVNDLASSPFNCVVAGHLHALITFNNRRRRAFHACVFNAAFASSLLLEFKLLGELPFTTLLTVLDLFPNKLLDFEALFLG